MLKSVYNFTFTGERKYSTPKYTFMSYDALLPLIKSKKSPLTPEQFHARVNVVFHDFEAHHYDNIHNDMRESLQEQIDLLIGDLQKNNFPKHQELRLLDIGCGTGLSTQILLHSALGPAISHITLLDTSPNMLQYAEEKAKNWGKDYELVNADIAQLNQKFDVVIICSVLHHIPNLGRFLSKVDQLLNENGILIHLQDPNGDFLAHPQYKERMARYAKVLGAQPAKFSLKKLFPKKWKQYLNRKRGKKTYIDLVNDTLLAEKTISKRMSADEIWSVTDIHVETKNEVENKGISLGFLKKELHNFRLINQRSYGFYGFLKSDLLPEFQKEEVRFIAQNDPSGRNLSAIWVKEK